MLEMEKATRFVGIAFWRSLQRKEKPNYSPVGTGEIDWEAFKVIPTLRITDTARDAVKFRG